MALDSEQLTTLAAVVQEGSFEAAARALRVTPSAVSQRVKALEQATGRVLIRREKPCTVTEAGKPLLRLASQIAVLEQEALNLAAGPIRTTVVVNADSLATWFLPTLAEVRREVPGVTFELWEDDQDHTAQWLRDGTAMAAVTAQRTPVQGCSVSPLGSMRYVAVAAPRLAAEFDIEDTPMICFNRKDQLQHRFLNKVTRKRTDPSIHYVPSVAGFTAAIRMGLGWGVVPLPHATDDLVRLHPRHHLDVPLYWQRWRLASATLDTLTDAVNAAAAKHLHRTRQ